MTLKTLFVAVTLLMSLAAVNLSGQTIKIEGRTMGPIEYTVVIDPLPDGLGQKEAAGAVQAALDKVNQSMSTYIPESEVSRFNDSLGTEWFELSEATGAVIQRSMDISRETKGAFDITVGPLVDLWKFGPDKTALEIPSDSEVKSVQNLVGFQKLEIRSNPPAVRKTVAGVRIDLSAIAKGYAVDRVAVALQELGVESCMVEVGGEVRTVGTKSDGRPWQIGIELPGSDSRSHKSFAKLSGGSMATSGDYRNFHIVDGKKFSHSIDPATAKPVTHQLASLSVIADDCMSADAYATAGLVLGPSKGKQLFDELGLEYYMLERDGEEYVSSASESFPVFQPPKKQAAASASVIPMFIGAAVIFGLAILGMAVGAMLNNKPITGSCGGLAAQSGETSCSLCHKPTTDCEDLTSKPPASQG